ncbi:MAG: DUF5667 domain-containing protein [Patescibacteria group bacterium]
MKRFSEQFNNRASTVKLQAFEREELRARVVSYMEYHPLPKPTVESYATTSRVKLLQTDAFQSIQIPASLLFRASALLTVALLIVVPVLAERSVPGDSLYAVKVSFNEEVRSTLTFTPYQKIEWETQRLNRRVAEAKLLANEGRLTQEVEVEIAAAVKEHTEEVQKEIAVLRGEDADQATLASIELSTTLELQSASLQDGGSTVLAMAVGDVASDNTAQLVVDVINASLSDQESQNDAAHIPAYDKIMARLEMNTTRAYELLQSTGLKSEDQIHKDITRRLEDVGRSIETAKATRGENETTASEQLVAMLERTQKLIVYMSDIEGNRAIALETIVPTILTPEEEQSQLAQLTSDINKKSEILALAKPKVSSGAAEKISYSIDVAATNKSTVASSSNRNALGLAKESIALLDDALKIVAAEGIDINAANPVATVAATATTTATSTLESEEIDGRE